MQSNREAIQTALVNAASISPLLHHSTFQSPNYERWLIESGELLDKLVIEFFAADIIDALYLNGQKDGTPNEYELDNLYRRFMDKKRTWTACREEFLAKMNQQNEIMLSPYIGKQLELTYLLSLANVKITQINSLAEISSQLKALETLIHRIIMLAPAISANLIDTDAVESLQNLINYALILKNTATEIYTTQHNFKNLNDWKVAIALLEEDKLKLEGMLTNNPKLLRAFSRDMTDLIAVQDIFLAYLKQPQTIATPVFFSPQAARRALTKVEDQTSANKIKAP